MAPYVFEVSANDALPLEYKLQNRQPLRQADVSDFINNAPVERFHASEKSGFQEKLLDIFGRKICVLDKDVADH